MWILPTSKGHCVFDYTFFHLRCYIWVLGGKKVEGERFSVKIIWDHTMPRMLISVVLVLGAFMWDEVFNQTAIQTYKVIGWFISGVFFTQ